MATLESALAGAGKCRIYLDRRVCTVTEGRIEVHPARSIIVLPLLGLLLGIGVFPAVYFGGNALPLGVLVALTLGAVFLVPVSGVGLVYGIAGANVVIERSKQSVVVQQGYLGMGVGTQELAPFWKIDYLQVKELLSADAGREELAQFEVAVVKLSGREISLGTVTVLRSEAEEGLARAREVAELVAEMSGSRVRFELSRPLGLRPDA